MKHLLFYIPYKIYKLTLISIDFTASVYELFDNPSYKLVQSICLSLETIWPVICTNFDFFQPRMISTKLGLNWSSDSGIAEF